uniref:PCI domain-containing protein n=1 Tax=Phakopsora pachyrhizi TaxID=170000 RepID=A0A0S1MIN5_PHAPC
MGHWVTYRYYMGVLCFLQEDYDKAEEHLYFAFLNCHRNYPRHRELILYFLIPLRLLKGKRPIKTYMERFGQLTEIYQPFIKAVQLGNIEMFDRHMLRVEKQLMKRGTYLIVERCRDACLCNLVKLIQRLKLGAHQIPLDSFKKIAYEVDEGETSAEDDSKLEEVECVLANLIAQDRLRGYIHHQAKMLVLSKLEAFPAQNSIKAC